MPWDIGTTCMARSVSSIIHSAQPTQPRQALCRLLTGRYAALRHDPAATRSNYPGVPVVYSTAHHPPCPVSPCCGCQGMRAQAGPLLHCISCCPSLLLQRDTPTVRLLLDLGAPLQQPFLLDFLQPLPDTLFATKASQLCAMPPTYCTHPVRSSTHTGHQAVASRLAHEPAVACTCPVSGRPRLLDVMSCVLQLTCQSCIAWAPRPLQAGAWSREGHFCFPPAFKEAVAELLRISHKHGDVAMRPAAPGGRRWPFDVDTLVELLLPVLARNPTDWL